MKKRLLTLLSAAVLCGMVSGCCISHDWQEATCTAPKTCAKCGETEGEPLAHTWVDATCTEAKHCSVCGATEGEPLPHEWVEATYETPKTCSVCGTTEGEPKQSYFAQYGVDVPDGPVDCTTDYIYFNPDNPEAYCKAGDAVWNQIDCYAEPVDEEGYQNVHLTLQVVLQPGSYYDAVERVDYSRTEYYAGVYDWYTGRLLPVGYMMGDDAKENAVTLDIDGVSYDVSYTKKNTWSDDDDVYDEVGNITTGLTCTMEYVFRIPEGYDGLVYCTESRREYIKNDENEDEGEVTYALLDPTEENRQFFRINHTELPVREAEPETENAE